MLRFGMIVAAAGCLAYGFLFQGSDPSYGIKLSEARRLLLGVCIPPAVFGSNPPDCEARPLEAGKIAWIAKHGGGEIFRYIATLKDAGDDKTKIGLELVGAERSFAGNVAKRLDEKPAIRDLYLVAMRERIASTVERRPYNFSQVIPATVIATASNISSLKASVDEAAAASAKLGRDNIEKAYRNEAMGIRR